MPKAFLVKKNGLVINKIVPTDESVTREEVLNSYMDPDIEVDEFVDRNHPDFVNSNNVLTPKKKSSKEIPHA